MLVPDPATPFELADPIDIGDRMPLRRLEAGLRQQQTRNHPIPGLHHQGACTVSVASVVGMFMPKQMPATLSASSFG